MDIVEEDNDMKWYIDLGIKGIRFGTFLVLCAVFAFYLTAVGVVKGGWGKCGFLSFIGLSGLAIIGFGLIMRRKYRLYMGLA